MNPEDILGVAVRSFQADTMGARMAGGYGTLGSWWSDMERVAELRAGPPETWPDGRITFTNNGLLRLVFGDLADHKPFISVLGADPARPLTCHMRFGFTDRPQSKAVPISFDPVTGRHYGVGTTCDGTLGQNGEHCAIELWGTSPHGTDWSVDQVVFGYVQLA